MPRKRWHILMAAMLLVGLAWIWVNRLPSGNAEAVGLPPAPAVGHPAPDFSLPTVDGGMVTLSELRGTPVVLNFWATWCPPCRAELPELQAASLRYADKIAIIGVNQVESVGLVAAFVSDMGLTFAIPLDAQGQVSRFYQVRSLPTSFFIDRDGVIRQMQIGPVTEATLVQLLGTVYP